MYERRASPLHAARAAAAGAYCLTLTTLAIVSDNPLLIGSILLGLLIAYGLAHTTDAIVPALKLGIPFGLTFALLNPLFSQNGLTVIARLGNLWPFGERDITLEALVYGLIVGLKFVTIVLAARLGSATIDPDELLRSLRRVSFHSALTATLTTRLYDVLAGDARRLAEAQRCRPDAGRHPRVAVLRAVVTGALDRALDVAATLEVRGFGSARRAPRLRRPLSRHDLAFFAAALAIAATGIVALSSGWLQFTPYQQLELATGPRAIAACAAIVIVGLLPFADRRGIAP